MSTSIPQPSSAPSGSSASTAVGEAIKQIAAMHALMAKMTVSTLSTTFEDDQFTYSLTVQSKSSAHTTSDGVAGSIKFGLPAHQSSSTNFNPNPQAAQKGPTHSPLVDFWSQLFGQDVPAPTSTPQQCPFHRPPTNQAPPTKCPFHAPEAPSTPSPQAPVNTEGKLMVFTDPEEMSSFLSLLLALSKDKEASVPSTTAPAANKPPTPSRHCPCPRHAAQAAAEFLRATPKSESSEDILTDFAAAMGLTTPQAPLTPQASSSDAQPKPDIFPATGA